MVSEKEERILKRVARLSWEKSWKKARSTDVLNPQTKKTRDSLFEKYWEKNKEELMESWD